MGRWLIVEVPLELTFRTPRDFAHNASGHINSYSMKLIRHLLQSCDLEIVAEITTNPSRGVLKFGGACCGGEPNGL